MQCAVCGAQCSVKYAEFSLVCYVQRASYEVCSAPSAVCREQPVQSSRASSAALGGAERWPKTSEFGRSELGSEWWSENWSEIGE